MTVNLSREDHSGGHTLVTHAQWVRLMVLTRVVHFVVVLLTESAVLALGGRIVSLSALLSLFLQEAVESLVLVVSFFLLGTVGALLAGLMIAALFNFLIVILGYTETMYALLAVGMLAATLLVCLIGHHLGFVMLLCRFVSRLHHSVDLFRAICSS